MINETQSFDSTLESPSKLNQRKFSPQKKAIFLVHNSAHFKSIKQFSEKIKINKTENDGISPKNKLSLESKSGPKQIKFVHKFEPQRHMLDFDSLLDSVFHEAKDEKKFNSIKKNSRKSRKKNLGNKTKRESDEEEKKCKKMKYNLIYI